MQIEKRLLTKRNLLLVRGMGGAGKTTLLRHVSAWWRTTGLVERVFYFGYDDRAWTHQQIMVEIAQQLLDPVAYVRDFQPLSLDAQQSKLASILRAHRHLLILDNWSRLQEPTSPFSMSWTRMNKRPYESSWLFSPVEKRS